MKNYIIMLLLAFVVNAMSSCKKPSEIKTSPNFTKVELKGRNSNKFTSVSFSSNDEIVLSGFYGYARLDKKNANH